MRAFGGMTYLRADLPVRQEEAEAQRSREMSAALLKTFGPVSHSLGKIVLAIHSQSLDAAIATSTMCQRVSRCFGKCPFAQNPPTTIQASCKYFARRANHFVFSEMACPAPFAKIFSFRPDPNQMHIHYRLVPTRGADRASSRTRGGRRWTRQRQAMSGDGRAGREGPA